MFEHPITFAHGDGSTSAGRIDLHRRGAFVLESKNVRLGSHTKGFDDAVLRARVCMRLRMAAATGARRQVPACAGHDGVERGAACCCAGHCGSRGNWRDGPQAARGRGTLERGRLLPAGTGRRLRASRAACRPGAGDATAETRERAAESRA